METKRKAMKILILGIIVVFLAWVVVKGSKKMVEKQNLQCITTVAFDISDSEQLERYLMDRLWYTAIFEDNPDTLYRKIITIKINDNLTYWTIADFDKGNSDYTDRLENIHVLGQLKALEETEIRYHDKDQRYPYLSKGIDFIEIAEDHYTLRNCQNDACELTVFHRNEIEQVDFDGTYNYNGRTFIIDGEDLYHVEVDKHYIIHQTDYNRLSISGQVISEMPSYRFWIDENENIILLSDGLNLYGIDEDLIKSEYPFYILVKQK